MKLTRLFGSRHDENALGHLKNLLMIAQADSRVDQVELAYIQSVARRYHVSARELKRLRKSEEVPDYKVPDSLGDRFQHLYDYLYVMMADREVDTREMRMCEDFAKKLGFERDQVAELVFSIEQNIIAGNTPEETLKRVRHLVG